MKPEARIYDFVLVYTGNELLKSDSGSKWEMSWPRKVLATATIRRYK
jgi:hypothetical protein